ncbi:phenylpyruvate tautomerase PptA (4-oxalocrotonate tautomerase family) [Paraburkholderia sp. GAS199]|uniref:hypothetical protein n=1 Tax=Paraburkholderia sp. GAS199 TaxID=3035126 RepID=UPI003D228D3A
MSVFIVTAPEGRLGHQAKQSLAVKINALYARVFQSTTEPVPVLFNEVPEVALRMKEAGEREFPMFAHGHIAVDHTQSQKYQMRAGVAKLLAQESNGSVDPTSVFLTKLTAVFKGETRAAPSIPSSNWIDSLSAADRAYMSVY